MNLLLKNFKLLGMEIFFDYSLPICLVPQGQRECIVVEYFDPVGSNLLGTGDFWWPELMKVLVENLAEVPVF